VSVIISAENLGKRFKGADGFPVQALDNINLEVKTGEFVSLIGPSGCGKSTLLRVIADLTDATAGKISVNGKSAAQARKDRDYGFVFQSATLYDWRTVIKNVQLPLEIMDYSQSERERRAQEMLKLVELSDFANKYPWQLSAGRNDPRTHEQRTAAHLDDHGRYDRAVRHAQHR
jgi:NitT/TauT family transport system ATP-binding protein